MVFTIAHLNKMLAVATSYQATPGWFLLVKGCPGWHQAQRSPMKQHRLSFIYGDPEWICGRVESYLQIHKYWNCSFIWGVTLRTFIPSAIDSGKRERSSWRKPFWDSGICLQIWNKSDSGWQKIRRCWVVAILLPRSLPAQFKRVQLTTWSMFPTPITTCVFAQLTPAMVLPSRITWMCVCVCQRPVFTRNLHHMTLVLAVMKHWVDNTSCIVIRIAEDSWQQLSTKNLITHKWIRNHP